MTHPALTAGGAALITGGASGLGLAAADRFAAMGLDPWLADVDGAALETAAERLRADHPGARVSATALDVSDPAAVHRWRDAVLAQAGPPRVLMNNAGVGGGGSALDPLERWTRVLGVNLLGVLHGVNAFGEAMAQATGARLIVNTGSKQGITTPPGDTAYNVSKAGVKALTEGLAHTLRNRPGCETTAHLFVPGFVFTGLTRRRGVTDKPSGAWTPEETVDHLLARLEAGDFYIVCPDNETTSEMDGKRIAWAAGDVVENRPALSRWHPDWSERFASWMAGPEARGG